MIIGALETIQVFKVPLVFCRHLSIDEKNFSVKPNGLSDQQISEIDNIIRHFKGNSASELELLTTAIYAYDHLDDKSLDSVIKGVQK